MKQLLVKILLKLLQWLGWHPLLLPVEIPTFEINRTGLERIELRFDHAIKYPQHAPDFDRYVSTAKRAIPYEMSKKLVQVIDENIEIEERYDGDPYSPYPVIHARMELFIKKK